MSDRVGIMSHGRMVAIHRPSDLDTDALVRFSAGVQAVEATA
jgi:hypothetical protein